MNKILDSHCPACNCHMFNAASGHTICLTNVRETVEASIKATALPVLFANGLKTAIEVISLKAKFQRLPKILLGCGISQAL